MAAKEMMVTAPVVVLLYDAVFLSGSVPAAWKERRTFYLMLASSWSLVLLLLWNTPHTDSIGFAGDVSPLQYATNQCVAMVQYLRLVLFPHPLVLDYGFSRPLIVAQWLPPALLLLSLAGVAIALVRRHPALVFLALAVVLVLSPTTSVIPLLNEFAAERRLYLPLAGMVGLVPLCLLMPHRRRWGRLILAALAAVFLLTSITRSDDYRSREAIWRSSLAAWPANPRNYANLGAALGSRDQDSPAIAMIRQAIAMKPGFGEAHLNLGTLFKRAGQQDSAIVHLRAALPYLKNYTQRFQAHHRLGIVLRTRGYAQQALEQQRAALQLSPTSVVAHYELAFGLHEQGDLKAAVESYRAALVLSPKYRPAHYNLGVALEELGQTDGAQYHLRMAAELARED
jgi:tetratricopeptide (TPR) repeat protein